MKISKADVVGMYAELGFTTVSTWKKEKLLGKIQQLPDMSDEQLDEVDEYSSTLEKLLTAIDEDDDIEFTKKAKKEESKPVKKTTKTKPKPRSKVQGKKTTKAKSDKPKVTKAKSDKPKKTGVIKSILEFIEKGSAERPISKTAILSRLVKRFPERKKDSMAKTIGVQLSGRLAKEKEVEIEKNEKGYWVVS